jgi:hypothetical protein
MGIFEDVATVIFVTILYDWLLVGRCSASFTSFDYTYFPMSKLRQVSIALLIAAALFFVATINPDRPPIIPIVVCLAGVAFHGSVALKDIFTQRRRAQLDMQCTIDRNGS